MKDIESPTGSDSKEETLKTTKEKIKERINYPNIL